MLHVPLMGASHHAEPAQNIENRLRDVRVARGLSQDQLAKLAGITRQAVSSIEANQYLPTTAVALRLTGVLQCRVEDLFNLVSTGEVIEGEWSGGSRSKHAQSENVRVKVALVGSRTVVRPVSDLGEMLAGVVPADGLTVSPASTFSHKGGKLPSVSVRLLRDRRVIEHEIAVAGCDPAIFLAGEHLRRQKDLATVIGWTMGSAAALEALLQDDVHVAGLHIVDAASGESNLPYLRKHAKGADLEVVTFSSWEEGLMLTRGNPKEIRAVADLGKRSVSMVNREAGAGTRLLLDRLLRNAHIPTNRVQGYGRVATSHMEGARLVSSGQADVALGVRSAARTFGLDFLPLQQARYDLVVKRSTVASHPCITHLFDVIVSRAFRTEIEALGGYDTTEAGRVQDFREKARREK